MEMKSQTNELKIILHYMVDVLAEEFPTDVFTPEYLIVSILDNAKSRAYKILDSCLMTKNLEELKNIYVNWLKDNKKDIVITKNGKNVNFDNELDRILVNAEIEQKKLGKDEMSSEHVLLSMLSPSNECVKIQNVFKNIGIDYNFVLSKCTETEKKTKKEKDMKQPISKPIFKMMNKGEVNKKAESNSNEYIGKYTISLNKMASDGKFDEFIG